jgi:mitogen-activated protein kinase kinase kinase kinase 1
MEEVGVGAAGRVLKARHKKLANFMLAVKIVRQGDKNIQAELEKEMEILKKCRSANVVAYYGTVNRDNESWVQVLAASPCHICSLMITYVQILMDYCGVGSVKDVIKITMENLTEAQSQYVIQNTLKGTFFQ